MKHLPLINKLDLNEIITGNIIVGNMHNNAINDLPEGTMALSYNQPYAEVGIGLENIFKVNKSKCNLEINTSREQRYFSFWISVWGYIFRYN